MKNTASKHSRLLVLLSSLLAACSTTPGNPIPAVDYVDLPRFMGDWYVIANIPTFIETEAYNAVENYRLVDDTTVATTFSFRKGGFDGERKVYKPTGFIEDTQSNAIWGMQFWWPFVAEYRVVYLDDEYTQTIIGRSKRDYVWLMARQPHISEEDYRQMIQVIEDLGYDPAKVQRVPQKWPQADASSQGGKQ